MNSPVMLCETGTLLIRATRWSIQGQTRRFCRVSYIGLTLRRASIATREVCPTVKTIPLHFNPDLEK